MSVFGDFLVRIFPHTPYLSVFSPNARKYGPEKLQIQTLFTQCTPPNNISDHTKILFRSPRDEKTAYVYEDVMPC